MSKIVHVGGARGVGKTTVTEKTKLKLEFEGVKIGVLHGGDILTRMAQTSLNRVWMDLNDDEKTKMRIDAWKIIKNSGCSVVLLDSHYVDTGCGRHRIILPEQNWKDIDHHIIIEAPVNHILSRREKDISRNRDLDINSLNYEITAERSVGESIAKQTGAGITIIQNYILDDAIENLTSLLKLLR